MNGNVKSMSTTTTKTTRDRGDRYGPIEWAQLDSASCNCISLFCIAICPHTRPHNVQSRHLSIPHSVSVTRYKWWRVHDAGIDCMEHSRKSQMPVWHGMAWHGVFVLRACIISVGFSSDSAVKFGPYSSDIATPVCRWSSVVMILWPETK